MPHETPADHYRRRKAIAAQREAARASEKASAMVKRLIDGEALSEADLAEIKRLHEKSASISAYGRAWTRFVADKGAVNWWTPFRPPQEPTQ